MSRASRQMPLFHPARVLCTWFGAGLAPKASGTFGSLAALPFAWALHSHFGGAAVLAFAAAVFLIGWWACNVYLRFSEEPDPSEIVIDEVAGQCLLLSALPLSMQSYAVAFLLFRLFDIAKPWPVSLADRRLKNGFGVMLDDVLAGFYPLALLLLLSAAKPDWAAAALQALGGAHG